MNIRLLPFAIADGAANMAADESLVRSATQDGTASLRFYGWSSATVSLGYFQSHSIRQDDSLLSDLPWVRRPSGGATLVHHHELTYALALPAALAWYAGEPWLLRMHRIILSAFAELRLSEMPILVEDRPVEHGDTLCFQQFTIGDVLCRGRKIVGSAQRKYRQNLLQHGSILLAQSSYTPRLPGIRELTGADLTTATLQEALVRQFEHATDWPVVPGDWTSEEIGARAELVRDRYTNPEWNERR